jgi:hypothetical protein
MKAMWICVPLACLAGCSSMRALEPMACDADKCVEVVVNYCDSSTGISVSVDPLVFELPKGLKKIKWEIVTPGFEFPSDGITVTGGGGEFSGGPDGSKKFRVNNKHSVGIPATDYKYVVKVRTTGSSSRDCKPLDPVISNK